jgi:hypothetical protein
MITCCYKCPRRAVACHTTCEEYLKQYEANRLEREAKHRNSAVNGYIREQATQNERRRFHDKAFKRRTRHK